jgi:hypothetical protein
VREKGKINYIKIKSSVKNKSENDFNHLKYKHAITCESRVIIINHIMN